MKIFDIDVSEKFIAFKLDRKDCFVSFRYSIIKGIYDISVRVNNEETEVEITNAYPPFKEIAQILWRVHFCYWLRKIIRKFRQ